MSTQVPILTPAIPMPSPDAAGIVQSVLAIKQNIETAQGTRGIVRASKIHGPSAVNVAIDAALRQVDNA
jgi:hypothetical protein